jgi:RHH-type proline utilization regulon transcriptional repressor/proline dehydrogenase/delta 1-pyrroline-5-carboxylate dehydrogenase
VCISPWNFPLAIFTGQVAAALVAGNTVLAKPAEQTPLTAAASVRLAHEAGIPRGALQFLPGAGEVVGAALVSDPRVMGVVFTGSTTVANGINRVLAARNDDPILIAETGGSTPWWSIHRRYPEQVVADVVESAFDSAGTALLGAAHPLPPGRHRGPGHRDARGRDARIALGRRIELSTDVGPVIDGHAKAELDGHIGRCAKPASECRGLRSLLLLRDLRSPTLVELARSRT